MAGCVLRDGAVVSSRQGCVVVAFFALGVVEEDFDLSFVGVVSKTVNLVSFVEKVGEGAGWWLNLFRDSH